MNWPCPAIDRSRITKVDWKSSSLTISYWHVGVRLDAASELFLFRSRHSRSLAGPHVQVEEWSPGGIPAIGAKNAACELVACFHCTIICTRDSLRDDAPGLHHPRRCDFRRLCTEGRCRHDHDHIETGRGQPSQRTKEPRTEDRRGEGSLAVQRDEARHARQDHRPARRGRRRLPGTDRRLDGRPPAPR